MDRLTRRSNFLSPPGDKTPEHTEGKVIEMKKFLSLLMALAMVCALTACGGDQGAENTGSQIPENSPAESPVQTESAAPEVTVPPVEDLTGVDTSSIPGLEDGVLTVGMECAYAPYNWMQMDDSNGAVPISNVPGSYANGYDVMIAKRICEAYGWELEIVSSDWDGLTAAHQAGTMDTTSPASP